MKHRTPETDDREPCRRAHYVTGPAKVFLYGRVAIGVFAHYLIRPRRFAWNPIRFLQFLWRALILLLVFRHNKVVRTARGHKLHLYLPAYPSPAFFWAIDSKLVHRPARPTTVVFSITKACRYHCPHCYQQRDRGSDLDEQLMVQTATQIVDAGVALFDIEGGEPLCRPTRLHHLVQALDPRCEIWVNTTGDGLEKPELRHLAAAGMDGIMVSIHSPEAGVHDAFTGVQGSFELACETLRLARRHGLGTVINCVLSEPEIEADGVHDLMDLARELDVGFVQLIHPKPAGRWLDREEQMQRRPAVLERVRQLHLHYNSRKHPGYPSLAAQAFEESAEVLGCTAGAVDRFYVNAHGEVQPCEFLNISFGNVQAEPFPVILSRMREAFPEPCTEWLCCTQAEAIRAVLAQHGMSDLPLPWALTQELIAKWEHGTMTPVYRRLGIYRPPSPPGTGP